MTKLESARRFVETTRVRWGSKRGYNLRKEPGTEASMGAVAFDRWVAKQVGVSAQTAKRARIGNQGGRFHKSHISQQAIHEMHVAQHGRCANKKCRVLLGLLFHVDHVVPLARGGADHLSNMQLLCPTCNRSKGTTPMEEFMHRERNQ